MIKPVLTFLLPLRDTEAPDALAAVHRILTRNMAAVLRESFRSIDGDGAPEIGLDTFDLRGPEDARARLNGHRGAIVAYGVQAGGLTFDVDLTVDAPEDGPGILALSFDKTFTGRYLARTRVQSDIWPVIDKLIIAFDADFAILAANAEPAPLPTGDPADAAAIEGALGRFAQLYALFVPETVLEQGRLAWALQAARAEKVPTGTGLAVIEFIDQPALADLYK